MITNSFYKQVKTSSNTAKNRVEENSTLITDSLASYNFAAKQLHLKLIQIPSGKREIEVDGVKYNIQKINSYHSRLAKFMESFQGVSTRHLPEYLSWFNFKDRKDMNRQQKKDYLYSILAKQKLVINKNIGKEERIPIAKSKRKKKIKSHQ